MEKIKRNLTYVIYACSLLGCVPTYYSYKVAYNLRSCCCLCMYFILRV